MIIIFTFSVKSDANNMLHTGFDMSSLIPYEQGVCICPEHDGTGQVPPLRPVSCDKNAVASCSKGKAVSIHDCPDIIRTRRSVDGRPKVPAVIISTNNQHARYKVIIDYESNGLVVTCIFVFCFE